MKEDIFTNLVCNSTVFECKAINLAGTTWIVPESPENENRFRKDLLSSVDNILKDFFELGLLLENHIHLHDYIPMYLDEIFVDSIATIARGEKIKNGVYSDINSPFLRENPEEIISALLNFFNKFGGINPRKYNRNIQAKVIEDLSEIAFGSKFMAWAKAPASFLAYIIFELYYRYTQPDRYIAAMQKHPNAHFKIVGDGMSLSVSLTLQIVYQSKGWHEKKVVASIFDLITLFLFYDDDTHIKRCEHCNAVFISPNEKAIYCSPACRNRANSKKSYERRKLKENTKKAQDKRGD
ncbi:hypothetical protein SAMN02745823_03861 [Sporobacter termitidis DSM 10068]|uniref:CGNR zinc finger domain-containing protein n=1 Tax=Sporobacter termitidis DSM 10068 TaxID=1123282 RepID=A0A1M5ZKQ4_9FIRM|nr:CGNR zinc finger domain-containing protein [Sporobacter termitidis]SHI24742.1 hypothetical protein SAMN02745823_03861 [Sporobacter termitidis DSM 10068]